MSDWNAWPDLMSEAADIFVVRRRDRLPAAVEKGRMTAAEAAREIEVWEAIAADWRFAVAILGGRGVREYCEPGDAIPNYAKRAAIATAIERARAALARQPARAGYAQEVEILEAMRDRYARGATHVACARLTLEWRRHLDTEPIRLSGV